MKVFAHVTGEKAPLYREIMRAFAEFKERFVIDLRVGDVIEAVQAPEQAEIEAALAQLCEWGNLEARPETTDAHTLEDFYTQRNVFRLTRQGEAAERSLRSLESSSDCVAEPQTTALVDIRLVLQKLRQFSRETDPDAGEIHRNLLVLIARFDDLKASAHSLIAALELRTDLRRLIDIGERFVAELVLAVDDIDESIGDIEEAGVERLLHSAAERGMRDAHSQWRLFRAWFIAGQEGASNAEILRSRARESLRALLSVVTSINDQKVQRIDRANDFRALARKFAEAASDADAHRLWRSAFGLGPARHLLVDDATLDLYEALALNADTSWLEAPPLQASMRHPRPGGLTRIIDRTEEKEKLNVATHQETLRIVTARARFETGRRMRLSELEHLETSEFELLLDLLGETDNENFTVKVEPTNDGRQALIATSNGALSGPDLWITIERNSSEEVPA